MFWLLFCLHFILKQAALDINKVDKKPWIGDQPSLLPVVPISLMHYVYNKSIRTLFRLKVNKHCATFIRDLRVNQFEQGGVPKIIFRCGHLKSEAMEDSRAL